MVVAGPEGFDKSQYRKFNMRAADLAPGDDFAMLREMLSRRFTRLLKEQESGDDTVRGDASADGAKDGAGSSAWPDLVLIDGGAGQLSAAHAILDELGIDNVPVIAIAKGPDRNAGRERFFMRGRDAFALEPRDPVLYFLQRLRDEAHRFAIGSHRARRKKALGVSPLDEVPGIGPARKRALLQHFGSAKAVSRAGVADLQAVEGISVQTAQTIYDFFHERDA
jgi:excinuclease ABC subunit C